jgi:hypothetical protein
LIRSFFTTRLRRRLAAALAVAVTAFLPAASPAQAADIPGSGYWMVASDGGIFSFGNAPFFGSTGNIRLNQPIVGIAATPTGNGYWMVATDGGIFSFGDAKFFGSTGAMRLNRPIVGMAATPSGNGYWLVASDGGIFSFGDAKFFGSTGNLRLNKPIVGMASTPTGNGYWFVASDGGIFAYGDAAFYGSTGNLGQAKQITAMATTPTGKGYWFTASDGGVFAFGDANFYGAAPARPTRQRTVAALVPSPTGAGYWQASSTGELFAFGDAADLGGLGQAPNLPIVGMTAAPAAVRAVPSGVSGATPGVPSGSTPTTSGGTGTTTPTTGTAPTTTTATTTPTTTTTTTTTIPPPVGGPRTFSSTAKVSWGTPTDPDRPFVNSLGETTYPYSQKVSAIAEIGDRVYIGGEFKDLVRDDANRTTSGVPLAYLAELDTNGIPVPGSRFNATVKLDGFVRTLYRSPDGRRLYVGGEFKYVNGEYRPRLVALDPATGEIDRTFAPPEPNGSVVAIAQSGSRLYIAGGFSRLGLVNQPQLAALNAASGALDGGFVPPPRFPGRFEGHTGTRNDNPVTNFPTGLITSLLVTPDGQYLMVGGTFLHFGYDDVTDPEHRHSGLIALDLATGALTLWQPDQGANSSRPVFGMTAYPGDPKSIGINAPVMIYTAQGGAGGRVTAWLPGKKTTRQWRGQTDGDVMGVAATRDRVYVVGHYDHTVPDPADPCLKVHDLGDGHFGVSCPDGSPSRHLAAFYASGEFVDGKSTGKSRIDTDFTAQADTSEGPYTVFIGANQMYIAGNFSKLASTPVGSGGMRTKQPGFAIYPAIS